MWRCIMSRSNTKEEKRRLAVIYIILIALVICVIYPMFFMVINSLKKGVDIVYHPAIVPAWKELRLDGYAMVFRETLLLRSIINTLTIIVIQGVLNISLNTSAAYAMAKIKFRGREYIFKLMLWSMMVPGVVLLIPTYIMFQNYVDTFIPLIVPGIASAYNIFLIRQFIYNIPNDIIDSAKIDGANHLHILRSIIIPMSIPVISTVSVLLFMGVWNDLLGPQIYLRSRELQTLQVALSNLSSQVQTNTAAARWAGMTIATIPLIFVYAFSQKYFVKAFTSFDLK